MPRLFIGNFDFEHRLAARSGASQDAALRRLNAELSCIWACISQPGDLIWCPASFPPDFLDQSRAAGLGDFRTVSREADVPSGLDLCPWGWTDDLVPWGKRLACRGPAPPVPVVREINSRRFSFEAERSSGSGLPGQCAVGSVEELNAALESLCGLPESAASGLQPRVSPDEFSGETANEGSENVSARRASNSQEHVRWVLKAEFSMAARERILGRGSRLDPAQQNWARKRLERDGVLFLEPWVERFAEAGIQLTIPQRGEVRLEGITPLLTGASGAFRGSCFADPGDLKTEWTDAVAYARRVASEAQRRGYFGPMGIDAVKYRGDGGKVKLRPLQDVNARYTMGRLSLGLRRLLRPGEFGSWLHVRWGEAPGGASEWLVQYRNRVPVSLRIVPTSPTEIDIAPVRHGTLAVFADCPDDLKEAEAIAARMSGQ